MTLAAPLSSKPPEVRVRVVAAVWVMVAAALRRRELIVCARAVTLAATVTLLAPGIAAVLRAVVT